MTVYVVHFYVLSGVNQAGIRYYRYDGPGAVFETVKLAEEYLTRSRYYRNTSMVGASRFVNSMDTSKYAMIHEQKVIRDTQDILNLKERTK